jgi:hypothetical protein
MTPTPDTQNIFTLLGSAQTALNAAYIAHWPPEVQALFHGDQGQPGSQADITDAQRLSMLNAMFAKGYKFSRIEIFNLDPYWEMKNTLDNDSTATWIKCVGTIASALTTAPLYGSGPVPADGIAISLDPAFWKPWIAPPDNTPVIPPVPKAPNPVGKDLHFGNMWSTAYPCDATTQSDGYAIGESWTGTVNGVTGTWVKEDPMAGIMIIWRKQ